MLADERTQPLTGLGEKLHLFDILVADTLVRVEIQSAVVN